MVLLQPVRSPRMEHKRKMKKALSSSITSASASASASSSSTSVIRKNEKQGTDFLSKIMSAFKEWFYHDADLEELQHQHQHHMITPKIFLKDCTTKEEHYGKIQCVLDNARGRHGLEGLRMVGFDYKFVPCEKHQHGQCNGFNYQAQESSCCSRKLNKREQIGGISEGKGASALCTECGTRLYHIGAPSSSSSCNQNHPQHEQHEEKNQHEHEHEHEHDHEHVLITAKNRQRYISDGVMYEAIARLCQEYAQDLMIKAGNLHWVTVCDGSTVIGGGKPIRMLVSRDYHGIGGNTGDGESSATSTSTGTDGGEEKKVDVIDLHSGTRHQRRIKQSRTSSITSPRPRPTLLITTGKGRVKAGIFSRQHLLISSIESSTALPMVRDAKHRGNNPNTKMNMNVAILDPNARGDRNGMKTYEESMTTLFGHGQDHSSNANTTTSPCTAQLNASSPIYILAHSASGAQLTRYLQSDQGKHLIPRVQSIAFTDSNHSIQWLLPHPKRNNTIARSSNDNVNMPHREHDQDNDHNAHIFNFYQSPSTIYLKSTNEYRDAGWQTHVAGEVAVDAKSTSQNDIHWQHRFGTTTTLWAGTKDHSLTNWTSHQVIWNHFDKCRCLSREMDS